MTVDTELKASIFDIHPLSTHDGPGIRTAFFFKGCSLKCEWCQNPESIKVQKQVWHYSLNCLRCGICRDTCPENALERDEEKGISINYGLCSGCGICTEVCPGKALKKVGEDYSLEALLKIVKRDKPFMTKKIGGGVTVTGGEPLLQADFITEFLRQCKELGVHTAVDTCGQAPWSSFEKVLPFTDLFLFDIKLMDNRSHKELTGSGNHTILNNLLRLADTIDERGYGTSIWIRTPLIPSATFTEENLSETGTFLSEDLKGRIDRWELCSFNPLPTEKYNRLDIPWKYDGIPLLTEEEGENALLWAQSSFIKPDTVFLTGMTAKEQP